MLWYYVEGTEQKGPVDEEAFQRLIDEQTIRADTLVWREGMDEWKPWSALADHYAPSAESAEVGVCVECGQTYPADQLVEYGDSHVCANCKDTFFQKVREGVETTATFRYGGFWIRGVALFIDGAILGFVNMMMSVLVGPLLPQEAGDDVRMSFFFAVTGVLFVLQLTVAAAYSTWFVGRFAATPGKMACGLRVVLPDGGTVSYARAFGRYFAEMLSGLILYIGYLMAAFDDEKRTLHDRICNTRVVYK